MFNSFWFKGIASPMLSNFPESIGIRIKSGRPSRQNRMRSLQSYCMERSRARGCTPLSSFDLRHMLHVRLGIFTGRHYQSRVLALPMSTERETVEDIQLNIKGGTPLDFDHELSSIGQPAFSKSRDGHTIYRPVGSCQIALFGPPTFIMKDALEALPPAPRLFVHIASSS
jgi:hypothetical protein